ncbi:MAG: Dyp-type peroxidase domain-containing protein [Bryobacteraceae bacterium]
MSVSAEPEADGATSICPDRRPCSCRTGNDLIFHIRSERVDLCFELARLILATLGASATAVDKVSGFDSRARVTHPLRSNRCRSF